MPAGARCESDAINMPLGALSLFTRVASSLVTPPEPSALQLDDTARLRRMSTRASAYSAGQEFIIVRVPQMVAGLIDVGHVSVLIKNHDGSLASCGFYGRSYRQGLASSMVSRDEGILITPCPLYVKAVKDPKLKTLITPLYSGSLSAGQASSLNAWTDDVEANKLELTKFKTSAGEERERAIATLDGERYVGAVMVVSGADNCATWASKFAPGCIECTFGMPRLCRPVV